jgi:ABC-type nitrate/sulfonate/bicarbonate transport system substrate-binding protein
MTDDLTPDDLADIEARAEAATEGPWVLGAEWATVASGSDSVIHGYYDGECPSCGEKIVTTADVALHADDAEFIAKARTDVPRLVRALREAWEVADRNADGYATWTDRAREAEAERDRLRAQVEAVRALVDSADASEGPYAHILHTNNIRAALDAS